MKIFISSTQQSFQLASSLKRAKKNCQILLKPKNLFCFILHKSQYCPLDLKNYLYCLLLIFNIEAYAAPDSFHANSTAVYRTYCRSRSRHPHHLNIENSPTYYLKDF